MQFRISTICCLLLALCIQPAAMAQPEQTPVVVQDSIAENYAKEDEVIEEIISSRTVPKKEKVQYFNQVTRYGFKNLFSRYSYNSAMPYQGQVNPNAENFVQDYMRSHRNYLIKMKDWGQPYFNLIESILQQYGLPKELKYIAVIESNLSTSATSKVGAGGPWQFMPYTAQNYGLVINSFVDERRDYYKSTHAAARYLLSLYRQLHDWLLVMAAYNGGPGRVSNAIKRSGSRNFWDLQYYLPEESRTYVKRFIATHYIMEGSGGVTTISGGNNGGAANPSASNSSGGNSIQPYGSNANTTEENLEVLPISGKYNSLVVAKNLTMDILQFNQYNPNMDDVLSATGNFELRLPSDKMQLFLANKYQILNESVQVLLNGADIPPAVRTSYPTKPVVKKTKSR